MEPKRILHVTSVLNVGGIETLLMNIFRQIDREKVIFDFLIIREDDGYFEPEIKALGGRIFKLPSLKKVGYKKFKHAIDCFFHTHKGYSIIHSHVNTWSGLILEYAKKHGIKTRIAHSHTAYPRYKFPSSILKSFWKKKIPEVATDFFACSQNASDWLFGENANCTIIKNGIDMEKYFFNAEIRTMIRNKLGLENNFVLIHVGRFSEEKNHIFLIKLFKQILDQRKDSVLILVGDGNTKSKIINKTKKLNIHDKIIFLGVSANANEILNCADVFIAPSTFEGFGTSLLEAQINGLPCIASKAFPKEVEITSNCFFLSIKSDFQVWKKHILNARRKELYKEDREKLILSDYNIRKTAQFLEKIYLSQ